MMDVINTKVPANVISLNKCNSTLVTYRRIPTTDNAITITAISFVLVNFTNSFIFSLTFPSQTNSYSAEYCPTYEEAPLPPLKFNGF